MTSDVNNVALKDVEIFVVFRCSANTVAAQDFKAKMMPHAKRFRDDIEKTDGTTFEAPEFRGYVTDDAVRVVEIGFRISDINYLTAMRLGQGATISLENALGTEGIRVNSVAGKMGVAFGVPLSFL